MEIRDRHDLPNEEPARHPDRSAGLQIACLFTVHHAPWAGRIRVFALERTVRWYPARHSRSGQHANEAEKLLQGRATTLEVVRAFAKTTPLKEPNIAALEAVNRFLAFKRAVRLYLRDLRIRLRKVAESLCRSAHNAKRVERVCVQRGKASRTRKNVRTTLNTFFAFARMGRLVAKDHPGVPQPGKKRVERCHVQIFSPCEMQKLLAAARPEVAVLLALTAFAGIRAAERSGESTWRREISK